MNKRKAKKKYKNLYLDKLASSPIVIDVTGGNVQFGRNREFIFIDRQFHQQITLVANIDNVGIVDLNSRNPYETSMQLCTIDGYVVGYKIETV
jgi:hypothetical protein